MLPHPERMMQIARLAGARSFEDRFGAPQTAAADSEALVSFVEEHLDAIAVSLVAEAAASDDVTDQASATSYLTDRIETLGHLLTAAQAERVRVAFRERTAGW